MLTIENFLSQTHEDILNWTIELLKAKVKPGNGYSFKALELLESFKNSNGGQNFNQINIQDIDKKLGPIFLDVAWELATKRVLRPFSISPSYTQDLKYELTSCGFSITQPGIEWLLNRNQIEIFLSPTRLNKLFFEFKDKFGDVFYLRAIEAIKCYHSDVYLACCVMCGAASEAIFLKLAIEKSKGNGNKENIEENIIKKYCSSGGRKKIEDELFGQQKQFIKEEIQPGLSLIKYWRDESGHATETDIKEIHAYNSLQNLHHLSLSIIKNYDVLISK